jgi:DNA processing protein
MKSDITSIAVSPYRELTAYEYLYSQPNASLKSVTKQTVFSNKLPSEALTDAFGFISPDGFDDVATFIKNRIGGFSIAINNTPSYPRKLHDSERPTPLIYYRGDIGLLESKSVSIVGTRKASQVGLSRAAKIARELVESGYTVVSGLAAGIDTAAMRAAIDSGGNVIGVIGTPIDEYYPKENKGLQDLISKGHLLISQVPFYKYAHQSFSTKKYYFPERNELMAAVSDATVIIEATDTSGTLTQARACLHQGRPLFILRSCLDNPDIKWPSRLLDKNPDLVHVIDTSQEMICLLEKSYGSVR